MSFIDYLLHKYTDYSQGVIACSLINISWACLQFISSYHSFNIPRLWNNLHSSTPFSLLQYINVVLMDGCYSSNSVARHGAPYCYFTGLHKQSNCPFIMASIPWLIRCGQWQLKASMHSQFSLRQDISLPQYSDHKEAILTCILQYVSSLNVL
jgi:hypothetical protein